jgi:hypothetical protein
MSTKPLRVHDVPSEVARLREEVDNLLAEINGRGPTRALWLRAKDLRRRINAQGRSIEQQLAFEAGVRIAFRERTLRNPEDGDTITVEDDVRAAEIVAALQSRPGAC